MALDDKARGQRIAQLRKRRRLTQQAMAERLKIGYRTYQTWESGTMPEWPNLEKLAEFFGVKPEYLIGEDAMPPSPEQMSQLDRIEEAVTQLLATQAELDEQVRLLRAELAAADAEALKRNEAVLHAIRRLQQ